MWFENLCTLSDRAVWGEAGAYHHHSLNFIFISLRVSLKKRIVIKEEIVAKISVQAPDFLR
jgi:hypothetical protein